MQFTPLKNEEQLQAISTANEDQLILKHNTTCSISEGVYSRLKEEAGLLPGVKAVYVLDLPAQRELSNHVAGRFGVPHQSPQILLIRNGRCLYHEWGFDISAKEISRAMAGHT